MPVPESVTSVTADDVAGSDSARTVSVPPSGIASTALKIRLVNTSRSSAELPSTMPASCSSVASRIARPAACVCTRHFGSVSDTAVASSSLMMTGSNTSV